MVVGKTCNGIKPIQSHLLNIMIKSVFVLQCMCICARMSLGVGTWHVQNRGSGSADPMPAIAPMAPMVPAVRASGCRSTEGVFYWRDGFRFTKIWSPDKTRQIGWQCACLYHDRTGIECRRRRSLMKFGGADTTLRMLKTWCVLGVMDGESTADSHADLEDEQPLSDAELEALELPPFVAVDEPRMKQPRRT